MSLGTDALAQKVANPYYVQGGPGIIGSQQISRAQLLRPFPAFGDIKLIYSDQNLAQYDSLVLRAQKRYSNGMTFLTSYTFSKNRDRGDGGYNVPGVSGSDVNAGSTFAQNVYDLRSEWALAIFDATHRLSLTGSYELPFGRGKHFLSSAGRAADLAVGGWVVNIVSVYSSGYPLIMKQNTNNNGQYLFSGSQRPNATGASPATSGDIGQRIDNWINPAAFSTAPALSFGTVSRTISLRGPGLANWDISLFKNFRIRERVTAQARIEGLNAFNTPYFRSPNATFGNSNFGQVLSQGNFPRFVQIGGRLYF
jgi:hypothetical protein